jgi:hypothetical protein
VGVRLKVWRRLQRMADHSPVTRSAPLRPLALLLVPAGLFALCAGGYDLAVDGGRVGAVTATVIVAVGVLVLWCGVAFARGRQRWWHHAVMLVAAAAWGPLDDRVTGEPLRLRPSLGVALAVAVIGYTVVRAARQRRSAGAALSRATGP